MRMAGVARIWAYDAPEHVLVRSEVRNTSCGLRARCAGGGAPNACVAGRCGRRRGRGSSDVAGRAHRAKARPARGAAREQSRGLCALPWPINTAISNFWHRAQVEAFWYELTFSWRSRLQLACSSHVVRISPKLGGRGPLGPGSVPNTTELTSMQQLRRKKPWKKLDAFSTPSNAQRR